MPADLVISPAPSASGYAKTTPGIAAAEVGDAFGQMLRGVQDAASVAGSVSAPAPSVGEAPSEAVALPSDGPVPLRALAGEPVMNAVAMASHTTDVKPTVAEGGMVLAAAFASVSRADGAAVIQPVTRNIIDAPVVDVVFDVNPPAFARRLPDGQTPRIDATVAQGDGPVGVTARSGGPATAAAQDPPVVVAASVMGLTPREAVVVAPGGAPETGAPVVGTGGEAPARSVEYGGAPGRSGGPDGGAATRAAGLAQYGLSALAVSIQAVAAPAADPVQVAAVGSAGRDVAADAVVPTPAASVGAARAVLTSHGGTVPAGSTDGARRSGRGPGALGEAGSTRAVGSVQLAPAGEVGIVQAATVVGAGQIAPAAGAAVLDGYSSAGGGGAAQAGVAGLARAAATVSAGRRGGDLIAGGRASELSGAADLAQGAPIRGSGGVDAAAVVEAGAGAGRFVRDPALSGAAPAGNAGSDVVHGLSLDGAGWVAPPALSGAVTQTGGTRSGVTQTGVTQTGVTQPGMTQTSVTQTGGTQTGGTQTSVTQMGVTQPGMTQTGVTQTSVTQMGGTQTGGTQMGVTQMGVTQASVTQTGGTQTGGTQTGVTQAGMTQMGMTQTGVAQASVVQAGTPPVGASAVPIEASARRDGELAQTVSSGWVRAPTRDVLGGVGAGNAFLVQDATLPAARVVQAAPVSGAGQVGDVTGALNGAGPIGGAAVVTGMAPVGNPPPGAIGPSQEASTYPAGFVPAGSASRSGHVGQDVRSGGSMPVADAASDSNGPVALAPSGGAGVTAFVPAGSGWDPGQGGTTVAAAPVSNMSTGGAATQASVTGATASGQAGSAWVPGLSHAAVGPVAEPLQVASRHAPDPGQRTSAAVPVASSVSPPPVDLAVRNPPVPAAVAVAVAATAGNPGFVAGVVSQTPAPQVMAGGSTAAGRAVASDALLQRGGARASEPTAAGDRNMQWLPAIEKVVSGAPAATPHSGVAVALKPGPEAGANAMHAQAAQVAPVPVQANIAGAPAPVVDHRVVLHAVQAPPDQVAGMATPGAVPEPNLSAAPPAVLPEAPPADAPSAVAAPAPRANEPEPAEQVAPVLLTLAKATDGTQEMTVRLQPLELGMVQVKITRSQSGATQIDITAEKSSTLLTLQRDQPQLHRTLDEAGIAAIGRTVTFHAAPASPTLSNDTGLSFGGSQAGGQQGQGNRPNAGNTDAGGSGSGGGDRGGSAGRESNSYANGRQSGVSPGITAANGNNPSRAGLNITA